MYAKYRICSIHFDDADKLGNGLTFNAVPTKYCLKTGPSNIERCSSSTQTKPILSHTTGTQTCPSVNTDAINQTPLCLSKSSPRKRKLERQIKIECKRRKIIQGIKEHSTPTPLSKLEIMIKQQKQLNPKFHGNRYTTEFKYFCLSVYFASPLAYTYELFVFT